jgi:hypothetical protein
MKYLKMLGLAAIAALALTAIAGSGAASAATTTLCKVNVNPCPATEDYPAGQVIKGALKPGTTATLTPNPAFFGHVTCTASSIEGKTNSTSGAPLTGSITSLTFTGCTHNGEKCTSVTAVNLPYDVDVTTENTTKSNGNGTMTVTDGLGAGAQVTCPGVNCTFTATTIDLKVTGGNPAFVTATEVPLKATGGFCPTEAKWDATYEVTSPKPLFVI